MNKTFVRFAASLLVFCQLVEGAGIGGPAEGRSFSHLENSNARFEATALSGRLLFEIHGALARYTGQLNRLHWIATAHRILPNSVGAAARPTNGSWTFSAPDVPAIILEAIAHLAEWIQDQEPALFDASTGNSSEVDLRQIDLELLQTFQNEFNTRSAHDLKDILAQLEKDFDFLKTEKSDPRQLPLIEFIFEALRDSIPYRRFVHLQNQPASLWPLPRFSVSRISNEKILLEGTGNNLPADPTMEFLPIPEQIRDLDPAQLDFVYQLVKVQRAGFDSSFSMALRPWDPGFVASHQTMQLIADWFDENYEQVLKTYEHVKLHLPYLRKEELASISGASSLDELVMNVLILLARHYPALTTFRLAIVETAPNSAALHITPEIRDRESFLTAVMLPRSA